MQNGLGRNDQREIIFCLKIRFIIKNKNNFYLNVNNLQK